MRGKFLTIEGIDGVGKSTLAKGLKNALESQGQSVLLTREPGGSILGQKLREILLHTEIVDDRAELLLFIASRLDHLKTFIEPALERGTWVICDRFIDSSVCYQGIGRGIGAEFVRKMHVDLGVRIPDLTLILDMPVEAALKRTGRSLKPLRKKAVHAINQISLGLDNEEDRFENDTAQFFNRVREGFLELGKQEPGRIHILKASGEPNDTLALAINLVSNQFAAKSQ